MLIADRLSKTFGRQQVLHEVSASFAPGTANVIIGPSGSGKSTFLRCLALLERPDSGAIHVDDLDYRFPMKANEIEGPWPRLTVVFQQHFLWPHLTNRENVALPLRSRFDRSEVDAKVAAMADLFEMKGFIERYPNESSVGQRQRVALARALVLNPSYVLLDEVTAALDVEQIVRLYEFLRTLLDQQIGIVIVTHLLSFAQAVLQKSPTSAALFLENGRVLHTGGCELLDNPPEGRVRDFVAKMRLAG